MLIPNIQKTFEETLKFHNEMLEEKKSFIIKELPELEKEIVVLKKDISDLVKKEKDISDSLQKTGAFEELEKIISELNKFYEQKGNLEEQKQLEVK